MDKSQYHINTSLSLSFISLSHRPFMTWSCHCFSWRQNRRMLLSKMLCGAKTAKKTLTKAEGLKIAATCKSEKSSKLLECCNLKCNQSEWFCLKLKNMSQWLKVEVITFSCFSYFSQDKRQDSNIQKVKCCIRPTSSVATEWLHHLDNCIVTAGRQ